MKEPTRFYRAMLLFQVYSGAIASLVCPPLLLGLLGNYLHTHHDWNRGWMAIFILLGMAIGFFSAISYLKKSAKITSMRSKTERESPYRIHRNDKNNKST